MAIIVKDFKLSEGLHSDIYVSIKSININKEMADYFTLAEVHFFYTTKERLNENPFKIEPYVQIPTIGIEKARNVIQALYPGLKKLFVEQGYIVKDDLENHGKKIEEEKFKQILINEERLKESNNEPK